MEKRIAKLVEFGRGGDIVHYDENCHGSGYGDPEHPHAAKIDEGLEIPDETIAIDKRDAAETPVGFKWVFSGPMVNVDLPDGECEACPAPSNIMASAMIGNQFGTMIAVHATSKVKQKRGSLDKVSIKEYVDGWRNHGARIGRYRGGNIIWEY